MRSTSLAVALAVCSPVALATGQDAAVGSKTVELTTIVGETFSAAIVGVDAGVVRAVQADGAARELPLDELESIACDGVVPLPVVVPGHVWLRSGADLGARVEGGSDGSVAVDLGTGGTVRFELVHLRALRLEAADAAGDFDGFGRALADPDATDDLLFAWNRRTGKLSRLSVRVLGIDDQELRVDYRGERSVPLDQVHGIVFGRDNGVRPGPPPLPSVSVSLAGAGPRLGGSLLAWGADALQLRLAEGPELRLPLASVDLVQVRSSRVLRLSAVAPDEVLQVPAFERLRPWMVDRAPSGPGLLLRDRSFSRGLCLVPRTRLTWNIEPDSFDVFEATIGIDGRSTGPADATFRVLLDGAVAIELQHVGPGSAETLRVPLGSTSALSIEVDFGERLDLGDHCVFADARLLKL